MNLVQWSYRLRVITALCAVCVSALCAQAQDGWRLEKDKDQIRVFSRYIEGSKRTELKVECTLPGTQSELVALLTDFPNYKNVIYKTKNARLIRRVSETELFYYVATEVPWPVSDRDMAIQLTPSHDSASKVMQIRGVGVQNVVPVQPNTVRIVDWLAIWQVRPLGKQQIQVTYTCRLDPGGEIPAWLNNTTAITGAYQSFVLIRKNISQPRYQGKSFDFLTP